MKNLLKILSISAITLVTSVAFAARSTKGGVIDGQLDSSITGINSANASITFGTEDSYSNVNVLTGLELGDTVATLKNNKWSMSFYDTLTVYANLDAANLSANAIHMSTHSGAFTVYSTGYLTVYGNTTINTDVNIYGSFTAYASETNESGTTTSYGSGDANFNYDTNITGNFDIDGALTLASAASLSIGESATFTADNGILAGGANTITTSSVDALSGNTTTLSSTLTVSVGSEATSDINLGGFVLSDDSVLTIELINSAVAIIESISVAEGATSSIVLSNYDDGLLQIVDPDSLYSFTLDGDSTYLVIGDDEIEIIADGYEGDLVSSLTNSLVSTVVPEPSTYAMIFGAIALGLAAYRRRK